MSQEWSQKTFIILLFLICVTGITQGLLIPLLTTLIEEQGFSSSLNGLSASLLYVGILLTTPFCPYLMRKWGFQRLIVCSLILILIAISFIPLLQIFWVWSILRLIIGVGDSVLHYTSQLWVTKYAPSHERGKRISQYGFAYGIGFGFGPLGMMLSAIHLWLPIFLLLLLLVVGLFIAFQLNTAPASQQQESEVESDSIQPIEIYKLGWVALMLPFLYGLLEVALTGSFPIYGMREGFPKEWISILITCFVWGSLILQIPLGILGDRWGRPRLLRTICTLGAIGLALVPFIGSHFIGLLMVFLITGALTGSLFSLGLAYLSDLLPGRYLPMGNAISSIHFSVGSMLGPYAGGVFIQYLGGSFLFYFLAAFFLLFVLFTFLYRPLSPGGKKGEMEETYHQT